MFYRDLFASLCFIFFGIALATQHPYYYFGAMMCGALSTTAKKKLWENPWWADEYYDRLEKMLADFMERFNSPKTEFKDKEEIKPLPPLDGK